MTGLTGSDSDMKMIIQTAADILIQRLCLHTYEYKLTEGENGLMIAVRCVLNDGRRIR